MVAILNDSGDILSKSITGDGMSFGMISEDPVFLEIWNELENVLPESVTSNKIDLQFYFAEDSAGDEQIWMYLDGDMMVEANIKSSYFTLQTGSFFQTFENETINLSDVNGDLIANVSSTFTYTHSDEYFFDDQHLTYESMTFSYETLNVSEYEMKYSGFVGDYIDWSDVESINVNETIEVLEDGTDKQSGSIQFMALSDAVGTKFLGSLEIDGVSMILRDQDGNILDSYLGIEPDTSTGADTITTGDGSDTIILRAGDGGGALTDADIITDFTDGSDVIGLDSGLLFKELTIAQGTGNYVSDTIISKGSEHLAILQGIDADLISEADFEPVDFA